MPAWWHSGSWGTWRSSPCHDNNKDDDGWKESPNTWTSPRRTEKFSLWAGFSSKQHPLKPGENADAAFVDSKNLGVFDGVSGVASLNPPLRPQDMSQDMAEQTAKLLTDRLQENAQRFDNAVATALAEAVPVQNGGWLKNLLTKAFLRTTVCGSTTLAVASLIDNKVLSSVWGCLFSADRPPMSLPLPPQYH